MGSMDTPVKDAQAFFESLAPLEATNGDKKLGMTVLVCTYAKKVWGVEDADLLSDTAIQARGGMDGWKIDRIIRAIEAAAEKQTMAWAPGGKE